MEEGCQRKIAPFQHAALLGGGEVFAVVYPETITAVQVNLFLLRAVAPYLFVLDCLLPEELAPMVLGEGINVHREFGVVVDK